MNIQTIQHAGNDTAEVNRKSRIHPGSHGLAPEKRKEKKREERKKK
jgi:hypothetical protein